jgi:hypothetical protein
VQVFDRRGGAGNIQFNGELFIAVLLFAADHHRICRSGFDHGRYAD